MPSAIISGLVAYPSEPADIGCTISRSLDKLHQQDSIRQLLSWEESDIPGRFISTEVLKNIESGTTFIADITRLNFNVVFEIGYAIGYKKRAILVRNEVIRPDPETLYDLSEFSIPLVMLNIRTLQV